MSLKLEQIEFIENQIQKIQFPEHPKNLYDPIRYFLNLGGKRIRPLLTILSAKMFGIEQAQSIHAGLAIELFHNFSLIHDDIMDAAPKRRNLPTIHEKWNTNIGILTGDVTLIHALEQLHPYTDSQYKKLNELLIRTSIEVCIGQQMDMDFENKKSIEEEEYLEMIRLKTSVLIACACAFGGILAEKEKEIIDSLYRFGENLGIAFQIQDDILDVYGDPEKFGKQAGGDILCNKKTILVTTFKDHATAKQLAQYLLYQDEETGLQKVDKIKMLFNESDVYNLCSEKMKRYHSNAINELHFLSQRFNTTPLETLLKYLFNREQ